MAIRFYWNMFKCRYTDQGRGGFKGKPSSHGASISTSVFQVGNKNGDIEMAE